MAKRSKPSSAEAFPTLARLGAEGAVYLAPKADEVSIRRMQEAARRDLHEQVPEAYVEFLRIANGAQINGAYFKEAENLVQENLDIRHPEIIVLGNDGNTAYYVFDKRDRRFHTINLGYPDERFGSYDNFQEMLTDIMKEQQVL